MRLAPGSWWLWQGGLAAVLAATPAGLVRADVILEPPPFVGSDCVQVPSSDQGCGVTVVPDSGAEEASLLVTAQASARHVGGGADAAMETVVSEMIPLSITRTVTFVNGKARVPILDITIDVSYDGVAAVSIPAADFVSATASDAGMSSPTFGSTIALPGGSAPFGAELQFTSVDDTLGEVAAANFSGAAVGEIDDLSDIPDDFRMWKDELPPFASDYATGQLEQTLIDTLTVSFRLRAESRPAGSISVGGSAIACVGEPSELSGFGLPAAGCGEGLVVNVRAIEIGTQEVSLTPEPGAVAAGSVVAALGALGLWRRRARRR